MESLRRHCREEMIRLSESHSALEGMQIILLEIYSWETENRQNFKLHFKGKKKEVES